MSKEELLERLNDIEWNDFEVKDASGGLPKSMWESVSTVADFGENCENNGENPDAKIVWAK